MPGKTRRFFISVSMLLAVLVLQAVVYRIFIQPVIVRWGSTEQECARAMPGDDLAPFISATRTIDIATPPEEVWKWLAQLGSDRGGFYSYDFLENLGGDPLPKYDRIVPKFQPMPLGRYVPAIKPDSRGRGGLGWKVVEVKKDHYFVLQGWGCFLLTPKGGGATRLTIRTHGQKAQGLPGRIKREVMVPLHYLMERKMMLGIRDLAQASGGVNVCGPGDLAWFAAIVLSGLGIAWFALTARGIAGFIAGNVLGSMWLATLFILPPGPWYGLALLVIVATAFAARPGRASRA